MRVEELLVLHDGRVLDTATGTLADADIIVSGDTIAAIVDRPASPKEARRIDASGRILIPGLVNAHTHSQGNLAKAVGDRWTLELLLNAGPWMNAGRTAADKYLSAQLGAVEMIRRGCTACYDLFAEIPAVSVDGILAVAQAYSDIGMRAVVAPMLADQSFYESVPGLLEALAPEDRRRAEAIRMPAPDSMLAVLREARRRWPDGLSNVTLAIAPTIPLLCSQDFLLACRALASEQGLRLHTHMAESRVWARAALRRYGKTLTEFFDELGLLGPHFTAAHAVWISREDMRRMADRGCSVAHNPASNMRLGSGLADIRAMLRMGINVGLGTDGCNCGDNLSMFEAMRLASFSSRIQQHDWSDWLSTREVVALATTGSARALGLADAIGRIAVGCKADLVFLKADDVSLVPLNDPINQLVHCTDGTAVDSVMIGGRLVLDRGRFIGVDYERLVADAGRAAERLVAANAATRAWTTALESVIGGHCSGLVGPPIASGWRP